MAHKLGLQLGQITKEQYNTLSSLKKSGDVQEYEDLEQRWGTTRKQLEAKYGKKLITELEKLNAKKKLKTQVMIRTSPRTRKKYPVRTRDDGVDATFNIRDGSEKGLWDTDTDDIL